MYQFYVTFRNNAKLEAPYARNAYIHSPLCSLQAQKDIVP